VNRPYTGVAAWIFPSSENLGMAAKQTPKNFMQTTYQAEDQFNHLFFFTLLASRILAGQKIDVHPLHFMTPARK